MAWAQNDVGRGVSDTPSPTSALNHCRSASTRLTAAIGASQRRAARLARSSNDASGVVSSTPYRLSAARRSASSHREQSTSGWFNEASSWARPPGRMAFRVSPSMPRGVKPLQASFSVRRPADFLDLHRRDAGRRGRRGFRPLQGGQAGVDGGDLVARRQAASAQTGHADNALLAVDFHRPKGRILHPRRRGVGIGSAGRGPGGLDGARTREARLVDRGLAPLVDVAGRRRSRHRRPSSDRRCARRSA